MTKSKVERCKKLDLYAEYRKVAQALNSTVMNIFIDNEIIKRIERDSEQDDYLYRSGKELLEKFKCINNLKDSPSKYEKFNQAYSLYAEIYTYIVFKDKGIKLVSVPKDKKQSPDFECEIYGEKIYFEVKCPDFCNDGSFSHVEIAKEAQANKEKINLQIEKDAKDKSQLKGKVYYSEQEIQPYNTSESVEILEKFIKKVLGMVKDGQIEHGHCFLILHLGRLNLFTNTPSCLLPVYCDDSPPYTSCETGDLWQVSFGEIGDQVYKKPSFEGEPRIGEKLSVNGILIEKENLLGIIFIISSWQNGVKIYSLKNENCLINKLNSCNGAGDKIVYKVSDAYNDKSNTNYYKYACIKKNKK
ncbi:MAG: hypothetical protein HAW67_02120 [Endozoicomonadaceae bacterium]|nr:hypothetical protein [Endozoicomonadaceae bacterium]